MRDYFFQETGSVCTVVFETNNFIVVNKNAGVLVHPPNKQYKEPTLVDELQSTYPEIGRVGDDPVLRPGIVHRLDREVSGLLVVARKQESFEHLKRQFMERSVVKRYQALVYGSVAKSEGEITLPLKKVKGKTSVMPRGTEQADSSTKQAVTEFVVEKRFQHYTLLEITLKTGRTHQIRAHLKSLGHSIVGDTKYMHPSYRKRRAFLPYRSVTITFMQNGFTTTLKSDRIFLHASFLSFLNLRNEVQEFSAELPKVLFQFLKSIDKKAI